MRWTLWGCMDHASDFGCSICFLSARPSHKPKQYTLRRDSWGTAEPYMPSHWQTWQWPLVTVVRPSIAQSTLSPSACSRALTVWHWGAPPWPGWLSTAPRASWWDRDHICNTHSSVRRQIWVAGVSVGHRLIPAGLHRSGAPLETLRGA